MSKNKVTENATAQAVSPETLQAILAQLQALTSKTSKSSADEPEYIKALKATPEYIAMSPAKKAHAVINAHRENDPEYKATQDATRKAAAEKAGETRKANSAAQVAALTAAVNALQAVAASQSPESKAA